MQPEIQTIFMYQITDIIYSRSMIRHKGAAVWNGLPNELQTITSLSIFKRNYKLI